MSITNELREWMRVVLTDDAPAHAIADRIDAEHQKACDDAWDNGYEADYLGIESWLTEHPQVMEKHGWIRLPKDADGEVIRIDDVMEGYGKTIEVVELRIGRSGWVIVSRDGNAYADTFAFSHHHAPTVEDVLREIVHKCQPTYSKDGSYTTGITEEEFAGYVSKLRLAFDGEEQ